MTPERWFSHDLRVLGLYLSAMASTDGRPVSSLLVLFNSGRTTTDVLLPAPPWGSAYDVLLDTSAERPVPGATWEHGATVPLAPHSVQVLAAQRG